MACNPYATRELEVDVIAVVSLVASVSTGCKAGARPRLQVPRDIPGFGVLRQRQFRATLLTFVNKIFFPERMEC
jgi:hypothetical protein